MTSITATHLLLTMCFLRQKTVKLRSTTPFVAHVNRFMENSARSALLMHVSLAQETGSWIKAFAKTAMLVQAASLVTTMVVSNVKRVGT